jgi:hypothetical protein
VPVKELPSITLTEKLPWLERTTTPGYMYEKLLHSFEVYLQEKWTVSKLMKAKE